MTPETLAREVAREFIEADDGCVRIGGKRFACIMPSMYELALREVLETHIAAALRRVPAARAAGRGGDGMMRNDGTGRAEIDERAQATRQRAAADALRAHPTWCVRCRNDDHSGHDPEDGTRCTHDNAFNADCRCIR
jgi:GGDEF domain-containing protein